LRPNLWPRGFVGFIDGETGVDKSTVLFAFIADLTTGADPVNVGIVNLEDPVAEIIVPRLKAAGADLSRVHIYEPGQTGGEIRYRLSTIKLSPNRAVSPFSLPADSFLFGYV
jgi:hypothetical protein